MTTFYSRPSVQRKDKKRKKKVKEEGKKKEKRGGRREKRKEKKEIYKLKTLFGKLSREAKVKYCQREVSSSKLIVTTLYSCPSPWKMRKGGKERIKQKLKKEKMGKGNKIKENWMQKKMFVRE